MANSQSLDSLSGSWKCIGIRCEKMCETCCQYNYYDLHIDDSIRAFIYPFQYIGSSKPVPSNWHFSHDTLISGDQDVQFYYQRTQTPFDPAILQLLTRDTIDPQQLVNSKWQLNTYKEDDIGEENFDQVIHFPFKLPKTFYFTPAILSQKLNGAHLMLPIDGVDRSCRIIWFNGSSITLQTENGPDSVVKFTYFRVK